MGREGALLMEGTLSLSPRHGFGHILNSNHSFSFTSLMINITNFKPKRLKAKSKLLTSKPGISLHVTRRESVLQKLLEIGITEC